MKFFKNYSLSIVLLVLFLTSWLGQYYFQWKEFESTQKAHNQPVEVKDFANEFGAATMENWQSEFLQLFSMVVLTSFLIHKGSAESRDSQDRMEETLKRIEARLGAENISKSQNINTQKNKKKKK